MVDEFYIFAEKFRARPAEECVVADVRELSFDGEVLTTPDGLPVNAIWRRSVTNDVLEFGTTRKTINAVRARKVALIGAFSGHIVHDKQLFEVLFAPETQAFLTEEEIAFVEETVPMTAFSSTTIR